MKYNRLSTKEIVSFLGEDVICVEGRTDGFIDHLSDASNVDRMTLDWIKPSNPDKQQIAEKSKASLLLVDVGIKYSDVLRDNGKTLIKVKNPKVALAKIGNAFFVPQSTPGIHPTAIIDPDAIIGDSVHIGPYSVVGNAIIGDWCVIDSNVRIHDDVVLGLNCRIKAGAVIGGEGFGFERDENGNKFRFPQIGRVIIGDDVEIGANTCVDRGALSDTRIGEHTKINNLCHIAHNNVIGRNVTIAGCVNISGSNVIEDNVWIAPHACIRGFLSIGERSVIGMGAIVTRSVPAGETWVGNPARKLEK